MKNVGTQPLVSKVTAVPEFDLKIGTKDIEVYGGGYYTPGAELRHP